MSNGKAYEVITARILDALDKGIVPWRKPWSLPAGMRPQSVTGHPYSGINALVLGMSGYSDPRWLTYRKAAEMGGNVRRGEKATPVVLWKPLVKEAEDASGNIENRTFWLLRYYSVFNVEQCEGLSLPPVDGASPKDFDPIEEAERIIHEMPNRPSIDHDGGDRAYYVPALDSVHLPPRYSFAEAGEYYSTAFHELGHSTGHQKRLGRDTLATLAPFGSDTYSREELVAEFTSAFLCAESGIENTLENSAAYIAGWSKVIRKDTRLVVIAAAQGQRAADYILGRNAAEEDAE
jgi:antirestriction protein ArdC